MLYTFNNQHISFLHLLPRYYWILHHIHIRSMSTIHIPILIPIPILLILIVSNNKNQNSPASQGRYTLVSGIGRTIHPRQECTSPSPYQIISAATQNSSVAVLIASLLKYNMGFRSRIQWSTLHALPKHTH